MIGSSPLVGRAAELEELTGALDRAAGGGVYAVAVEGEAGIGKSRLTAEVIAMATRRGFQVVLGAADEINRSRPFGPLHDALASVGMAVDVSDDPSDYVQRDRVLDRIEERAAQGPVLLVLEDVHWADPATVATLPGWHDRLEGLPLLVIVTCRPLPREPDLDVALSRLDARVHLGPLLDAEAAEVVSDLRGARLAEVVRRSGGNPFFLLELARCRGGADSGDEKTKHEKPEITSDELPTSVVEAVFERLRSLSSDTLDLVRIASVLGSSFALADLAVIAGQPAAQLLPKLMEAMRAGVIGERDNRLVFRHDIVRDAAYLSVPKAARPPMHRDAAHALAAAGASADRVADQLWLSAERGDLEAVTWLKRAAAEAAHTPAAAVKHLERAITLTIPGDPARSETARDLVLALQAAGRLSEAEATCRRALEEVEDPEQAGALYVCLVHILVVQGNPAAARAEAAAPRAHPASLAESALIDAFAAMAWVMMANAPGAEAAARKVAAESVDDPDGAAAYFAQITLSAAVREQGRVAEATTHIDRAVALARNSANRRVQIHDPEVFRLMCLIELGDLDDCARSIVKGRAGAERRGLVWNLPDYHYLAGRRLVLLGEWDDAAVEFEAGLALDAEVGSPSHAEGLAFQASLLVHRGDLDGADAALAKAAGVQARTGTQMGSDLAAAAAALVAQAHGESDPFSAVDEAWLRLSSAGASAGRPEYAVDLVRAVHARGDQARAGVIAAEMTDLAARSGSALYQAVAQHCVGLADQNLAHLEEAIAGFGQLNASFLEARATEDAATMVRDASASKAGYEAALACYESLGAVTDLARVTAALRAIGVRRGSRARHSRATVGWESLTPTELTVIGLIAEGLTSAQVAARLYVSPHTVITHVKHMFAKLGVSSRVELAAAATRQKYESHLTP